METIRFWSSVVGACLIAAPAFADEGGDTGRRFAAATDPYIGAALGQSRFDDRRCAAGFSCDRHDLAYKLMGGMQFLRIVGVELGYVNLGSADRDGGQIKAQGLDLDLVGNLPLGPLNLFAKAGGVYSWSEVTASAPRTRTGSENGFDWTYGLGLQYDIDRHFSVRGDWDKYRIKYVGRSAYADLYSLGVVYKF